MNFFEFILYLVGILIIYVWVIAGHPPHWTLHLIEVMKGILWQ
jgi:hypothetical protein